LQLDDLEAEGEARALAQLARVRAMRGVAHKIIEMLAQLENFQTKLWLKKKFVVSTDYCVTLDKLIENAPELLNAVAGNEAQRREWMRLFAIDELKGDALGTTPAYSEPLTRAFLEANPFLVLDTQFFDAAFKDALLASFDDLDAQTDGLLIKSENFQALNLLQAQYKEQVKCIYIDPPYNTGEDGFAYKDAYQSAFLVINGC
jgi:adenine-specific DNA-methyltransferase